MYHSFLWSCSNGDRKIKTKGVVMTIPNKNKLTTSAIENLIKTGI